MKDREVGTHLVSGRASHNKDSWRYIVDRTGVTSTMTLGNDNDSDDDNNNNNNNR